MAYFFFFFSILVFHSEDQNVSVLIRKKKRIIIYLFSDRSCAFAPPAIHRGEIMNGEGGKN